MDKNLSDTMCENISILAKSMWEGGCFGLFRGSISYKINESKFFINKKTALFSHASQENFTTLTHKRDYSYQDASSDAFIHSYIYKEFDEAKCIAHSLNAHVIAYSLLHDIFEPKDYFGHELSPHIPIYNPKDYSSWNERADVEIGNFLRQNNARFAIVRGYGIFIYERDLGALARTIWIIQNSAKILLLTKNQVIKEDFEPRLF